MIITVDGNVAHLRGICRHLDAQLLQCQLCQSTSHTTGDGLTGRGTSPTTIVTEPILLCISEIGMGRTEHIADIGIIVGMLVGVAHQETNRASCRLAFEDTRQQLHLITFLSASGDAALSRTTTIEFRLDKVQINSYACRHAIHHTTDTGTMTLTECGQRKYMSKRISHGQHPPQPPPLQPPQPPSQPPPQPAHSLVAFSISEISSLVAGRLSTT